MRLYPVRLGIMPYNIWTNAKIALGWFDGSQWLSKKYPISWNNEITTVQSAVLVISADPDATVGSTTMKLYMNGNLVLEQTWRPPFGSLTWRIDVSAFLYNGPNFFEVEYSKTPLLYPQSSLILNLMAELTYEGEEPPDPPPDWPEWWPIPVVAAIGIVGYSLYSYYK